MAGRGRTPYPLESMLRVHLMQNWFALSDPAMEEALYEIASLRTFARLSLAEPIQVCVLGPHERRFPILRKAQDPRTTICCRTTSTR